ncbi:hypothetical protein C8J57DRAFT_1715745 [Mycena rebaudengoi]|nr:hypothetical protein C8J57DRAFT_1715745 [Mycena rebaudengoi]
MAAPADIAGVATAGKIGGIAPDSAQVVLLNVCTAINFSGCSSLNFGSVPTGCISVPAGFNDVISSAQAVAGVRCTLFENSGCGGRSVTIAGNVANFVDIGFNDLTSSLSCVST